MLTLDYEIECAWPGRPEEPADIGATFLRTLDTLSPIDPLLAQWGYFDEHNIPDGESFDLIRLRMAEFVAGHVWRDEYGEPGPTEGYAVWASNLYRPGRQASGQSANVYVRAGSLGPNQASFTVGREGLATDPRLMTYDLFRSVLTTLIPIWRPQWANVRCTGASPYPAQVSCDPTFPNSSFQMPWMAYLDAERAQGVPIPADLATERTADGGLLMLAATTPLNPANLEHMVHSKQIVRILMDRATAL